MRPGSGAVRLAAAAALAVAVADGVAAHRRDEQLQAARIAIAPDRVGVDLDITPGADLAAAVIEGIDGNRDGALSGAEQEAYARSVARALRLATDREAHELRMIAATFPDVDAIRRGEGTIALRLEASFRQPLEGRHALTFGNGHEPGRSVYLANALVPASDRVTIAGQQRSATQHELTIDYAVAAAAAPPRSAVIVALASAAALFVPLAIRVRRRGRA